jgi:hypothetical protein
LTQINDQNSSPLMSAMGRRDDEGYTVFDIWTGWPAKVANVEQIGLDIEGADDLVDLLNLMDGRRQALP